MSKTRELKMLRRWCRDLDLPPLVRRYVSVETRRGAIVGTNLDGTPIRHKRAFQARLDPACQRAVYRDLKRRLLATL
jgi:hypothetical protein